MAIKRFGDYEKTQAYGDYEQLPRGGYVVKILGAEVCENSRGQYVKIGCDIAEGEYAGFYAREYKAQQKEDKKWHCNYLLNIPNDDGTEQDGWTKRRFKTFTEALEDSNPGYHFDWDEQKFKGKIIGGLFNEREYKKSTGGTAMATNFAQVCTVEKIHSGKYTVPEDRLLKNQGGSRPAINRQAETDWMTVAEGSQEELPFD